MVVRFILLLCVCVSEEGGPKRLWCRVCVCVCVCESFLKVYVAPFQALLQLSSHTLCNVRATEEPGNEAQYACSVW